MNRNWLLLLPLLLLTSTEVSGQELDASYDSENNITHVHMNNVVLGGKGVDDEPRLTAQLQVECLGYTTQCVANTITMFVSSQTSFDTSFNPLSVLINGTIVNLTLQEMMVNNQDWQVAVYRIVSRELKSLSTEGVKVRIGKHEFEVQDFDAICQFGQAMGYFESCGRR